MPLRLPAKRRNKDDGERPNKKVNEEPAYDNYDDAMEGGIEAEGKGERFRDGEKVSLSVGGLMKGTFDGLVIWTRAYETSCVRARRDAS
jgi:hypothetical protein